MIADDHLVFGCGNAMEEACRDYGSNSSKMQLLCEEVRYLGPLISGDGLKPDPEKMAAIIKKCKSQHR